MMRSHLATIFNCNDFLMLTITLTNVITVVYNTIPFILFVQQLDVLLADTVGLYLLSYSDNL